MLSQSLQLAKKSMANIGLASFSFDVFDTFLLRKCAGPEGVYERAFQLAPIPESRRGTVESFIQNRIHAEINARSERYKKEQKGEVSIEAIYRHFPLRVYGLEDKDYKLLADAEFKAELDLCFVNSDIYELVKKAKKQRLKVGFLSDTYWSRDQLDRLLKNAAPDLEYDFLYPSCEYGVNKVSGLFSIYLEKEKLQPKEALHMGDNPLADIAAAQQLGIDSVFYPQSFEPLQVILKREIGLMQMMHSQISYADRRLENGLTVLRRLATARLADESDAPILLGVAVLGPALAGFQRFIEQRIEHIRKPDRKVAVVFLARDGYLPKKLWDRANVGNATYVEINSRVTVLGGTKNIEMFQEFFRPFSNINSGGMEAFFKKNIPAVTQFLDEQPNHFATGDTFANALPELLNDGDLLHASEQIRKNLINYLKLTVPDFEDCTDLVMIDIGYRGTIQHTFRETLNVEGYKDKRLHGIYIASVDSKFTQMREGDTAVGFIDGSVLTPGAMGVMLRNVTVLEQCCSAPVGSVSDYNGAEVIRENDKRSPQQLAMFAKIQDACVAFFEEYLKLKKEFNIDPFVDMQNVRPWAAVMLMRFLLRPTMPEQYLFGKLKHDLNLGTESLADFIDLQYIQALLDTMTFAQLCTINQPVGWLAGSLSTVSPMAAQVYSMVGFGFMEAEMLSDRGEQQIQVKIISGGQGQNIPATQMWTGFGDIRMRIAIPQKHTGSMIAIPLENVASHGVLRTVVFQHGESAASTLHSQSLQTMPIEELKFIQAYHSGPYFRAEGPDSYLLIEVPEGKYPVSIVTVNFTPLPAVEFSVNQKVVGAN